MEIVVSDQTYERLRTARLPGESFDALFSRILPQIRLPEGVFLEEARGQYRQLVQSSPVAPYMPVKLLRGFVCRALNLDADAFDTTLLSIAIKDPHTVQLSTGSGVRGTGIVYGRGECHVVIIK